MKTPHTLLNRFLATTCFVLVVLAGCTDSMLSPEEAAAPTVPSKMRHAHLYQGSDAAGKLLNRFEDLATHTEFVVGFAEPVLDMQRILYRYGDESGVTLKRSYSKVFKGMALSINGGHVTRVLTLMDADDEIAWVEPDPEFTYAPKGKERSMPSSQQRVTGLNHVNAHHSSTEPGDGFGSVAVDLYILDTGVADHPDLNIVERVDFTTRNQELDMTKVLERMEDGLSAASDGVGHGTHVAGIAGAIDDTDDLVGTSPGARIHDFRVLDSKGKGAMSSVVAAFDVIRARKLLNPLTPMVVNLSLGADVGTEVYNAMDQAIVAAIEAGVVVVVAAGNDGIDASNVTPAHVAEAITVGSSKKAKIKGKDTWQFSSFSNHGALLDLIAPGEDIMSFSTDVTKTVEMTGTSMASPFVAGAAALYLSNNPLATPEQVRAALVAAGQEGPADAPAGTIARALDMSTF